MNEVERDAEVSRWLRFAEEDLRLAEALVNQEDAVPRHICFLAQQAAEKTIKAGLVFLQVDFPFTYDLDRLRNLLHEGWSVKVEYADLAVLSEWAAEARYPGSGSEATGDDAEASVSEARAVVDVVRRDPARHGFVGTVE